MPAKVIKKIADDQLKGAPRALLEDLFEDYYKHRHRIYWMNFIRGIVFGLGGAIGGSVIIALILWLLSIFHNVPLLSGLVETVQHSIEEAKH